MTMFNFYLIVFAFGCVAALIGGLMLKAQFINHTTGGTVNLVAGLIGIIVAAIGIACIMTSIEAGIDAISNTESLIDALLS